MTGLDKMTAKIAADAEAVAADILAAADEECRTIIEKYKTDAEERCKVLDAEAERECEAIIARARTSAVAAKREVYVDTKSKIIDEAYQNAYREIKNLSQKEYLDMLISMLKGAVRHQFELERQNFELYGEEPADVSYEVLLNPQDRAAYGKALIDGLHHSVVGKLKLSDIEKVKLSRDTANISGGLILRAGDIETNCSFEMLFSQVRRVTEAKVTETLFRQKD